MTNMHHQYCLLKTAKYGHNCLCFVANTLKYYYIRHTRTFKEMALWLTGNFSREISYNRLKNIFGLGSENTAKNNLSHLEEAWLFFTLQRFSFKKQESLRYRKLYLTDTSFSSLSGESGSPDRGRLLETSA